MTGAEVILEIVRQMREIIAQENIYGYNHIEMGREEHLAMIIHLEDTGAMPVMKKRRLPDVGCEYHGTKIYLKDENGIKVFGYELPSGERK